VLHNYLSIELDHDGLDSTIATFICPFRFDKCECSRKLGYYQYTTVLILNLRSYLYGKKDMPL
jgi:hypothetical protein